MNEENKQNIETRIIHYLNELVCEHARRVTPPGGPDLIDNNFIMANVFYGKLLADVISGSEPTLRQFEALRFIEGPEVVLQAAVYLFHCWKNIGMEGAVRAYCQNLNRLVERTAQKKSGGAICLLPDFLPLSEEIRYRIRKIAKQSARL